MNAAHCTCHRVTTITVLLICAVACLPSSAAEAPAAATALEPYVRPGELAALPDGAASLFRVPWRANARTVSAAAALDGVGVYYKHVPNDWTLDQHTAVMKQLAACGVRRLRLAPHHAIYITKDWQAPKDVELASIRNELRACKAAGIRPCVVFVHIPPIGQAGTRELQDWWRQGELMPAGEVGTAEFAAYQDKTYQALRFVLDEARAAGFTAPGSYDLELGQNLWWGAPAVPRPLPSTTLDALRPGGRIYEFDLGLAARLRKAGFAEPLLWWGQTHHQFENCRDEDVPAACAGRAASFYSAWTGTVGRGWLTGGMYDKDARGPGDVWPVRGPLKFAGGDGPDGLVLARPESWAADRTRRDCLIELLRASRTPTAITSLGTVPEDIPGLEGGKFTGWQIKQRALTRSLAFWLNQGAAFVLLHSAYEPGRKDGGEMTHSLIPSPIDPAKFTWQQAPPLVTLKAFCDGLGGAMAKPVAKPADLSFRFAVSPDPVLVAPGLRADGKRQDLPACGKQAGAASTPEALAPALRAGDCVALLPFQLDEHRFAVAAYVLTPNIAQPLAPLRMTLVVDRRLTAAGATTARPATGAAGIATVTDRADRATTLTFDIADDVTWVRFEVE